MVKYGGAIKAAVVGGSALFLAAYNLAMPFVKQDELAVKQTTFSPFGILGREGIKAGPEDKTYDTGKHFIVPGLQKLHRFPKDVQVLNYAVTEPTKDDRRYMRNERAAHIQTSDGFYVDLDISIFYRVTDPKKTITSIGAGKLYEENGIVPRGEPALKDTLGKLQPKDFYNVEERIEKAEEARTLLNSRLAESGMEVSHIQIRKVTYHPKIRTKMLDKIVETQVKLRNTAESDREASQAKLSGLVKEGTEAALSKKREGDAYKQVKHSEQEAYARKKTSDADKLVKLAEAESKRLVNEAYEGEGSDMIVGLEGAKLFKNIDTIYLPVDQFTALEAIMKSIESSAVEGGDGK